MEDQNLMDIDTFFDDDWVPLVAMAMMADASTNTTAPPPPPQQPRPKPGLPSTILQELLPPAALPTDPCYFLNIPAEIRLMIYPYLLLPQVRIIFSKRGRFAPTPETDWVGDEYPLSIGEDEEYDELLKDYVKGTLDKRSRLRCEEMRRKISSWKLGHDPDEVVVAGDSKKEKWEPRHMAILRANQQIHDEASTQFYCDAILYMDPEDIFSLSDLPVPSEPTIWAYHPFGEGPKQLDKSQCEIEYVGHPRGESTGKLDPKVFARFQQIEFDLSFEGYFVPSEIWIDDETNVISDRTAKRYKKNLNRCRLIEDFVRLVSLLPKLALCVWLRVEVEAMSTRLEELEPEYDLDAMEGQELTPPSPEAIAIMERANERATELFLDSDILRPFLRLTNTVVFNLFFDETVDENAPHSAPPRVYQLLPRHVRKIQNVKSMIEGQYIDRAGE